VVFKIFSKQIIGLFFFAVPPFFESQTGTNPKYRRLLITKQITKEAKNCLNPLNCHIQNMVLASQIIAVLCQLLHYLSLLQAAWIITIFFFLIAGFTAGGNRSLNSNPVTLKFLVSSSI